MAAQKGHDSFPHFAARPSGRDKVGISHLLLAIPCLRTLRPVTLAEAS